MKLDHYLPVTNQGGALRIGKRTAYHLAGRIAAIHYGNAEKNLPAVHFQVVTNTLWLNGYDEVSLPRISSKSAAKLEGGRLIPELPCCFQVATRLLSAIEKQQCQTAFEADVINLLAGSLAEAKYVALRDGEVFNANLVYLGALKFYGGAQDLAIVEDYLDCLYRENAEERRQKLAELFLAAYGFINNPSHWCAVSSLAEALSLSRQEVVPCEELVGWLERWPVSRMAKPVVRWMGRPL